MSKYSRINGEFVKNTRPTSLTCFEVGHTYVPIKNEPKELEGCIVIMHVSPSDKEVLYQYKHSDNCALCRSFK